MSSRRSSPRTSVRFRMTLAGWAFLGASLMVCAGAVTNPEALLLFFLFGAMMGVLHVSAILARRIIRAAGLHGGYLQWRGKLEKSRDARELWDFVSGLERELGARKKETWSAKSRRRSCVCAACRLARVTSPSIRPAWPRGCALAFPFRSRCPTTPRPSKTSACRFCRNRS